jgi:fatty acid desaturase
VTTKPCPVERNDAIEWPTLALFAAIYASWLVLVLFHAAIPLWLWLPLAAWTSAWWGSAQHEALHGHPTRYRGLNTALATPPIWLWMPFERYRQTHLKHHHDERLTDPLDDPESRYKCPDGWRELGPLGQVIVRAQTTLLGRLVIGPFWSLGVFWLEDALALRAGDPVRARIWLWHVVWVSLLLAFAIGVAGVPFWQYLLGFVYLGTAVALIRSFAEHKADESVEKRTAIVENSPVFGLLFLHNNLHVAHHKWPTVPWYRLPKLYADNRDTLIRDNGGLVYNGYRDVFRRFFLRWHDVPVHPLGRVPDGTGPAGERARD